MSFYIKLFGLAMLFAPALALVKGYRRYINRRISEEKSFLTLLLYIKGRIKRYLTPTSEIINSFSDENLSRIGFHEEMAKGKGISEAFENVSGKLSVGNEFKDILQGVFSTLGAGYKEDVLMNLDDASESLEKILEKEKEILHKDEKVFSAVIFAGVLGIFILFV